MTNSVQPGSKARQHTAREATAYHEAGHAVVAWRLGHRPDMVTIVATGEFGGAGQACDAHFPGFSLDFDGSDRARLRIERAITGLPCRAHRAKAVSSHFMAQVARRG